nr:anaerobic ribonucleoside-triphosphate reductase activating protein [Clostridia bacterium]
MHYGAIKKCDVANGEGIRTSLFVSGCRNRCPGCFQPETWAFDYGSPFTEVEWEQIFDSVRVPSVRGITVLGGEPMEPENQVGLYPFLSEFKNRFPDKTVWLYTGYTYEMLTSPVGSYPVATDLTESLLSLVDILVDGRFVEEKKQLGLRFRGSSNQRVIDMRKTREAGKIIIWEGCQIDRRFNPKSNGENENEG